MRELLFFILGIMQCVEALYLLHLNRESALQKQEAIV
jgi:hypothetical protein